MLREGSSGWTCLPDPSFNDPEYGPMCHDAERMEWAKAFVAGEGPEVDEVGVSYTLSAGYAVSSTQPDGTSPRSSVRHMWKGMP